MSGEPNLRRRRDGVLLASDEDRERLVAELTEHAASGRLTTEELEERLQLAYRARTIAELDELRHDLPRTPREVAALHTARRAQLSRQLVQEAGGSFGVFLVCTGIWLVSSAHRGQFWPMWILIVVLATLVRSAWGLYGPAPDLDAIEERLNARRRRDRSRSELRDHARRRALDRHRR
jgi:hypothetical protein